MSPIDRALAYHTRSKHRLDGYARSLGYLDWATQPDPFRSFEGAPRVDLPLLGGDFGPSYRDLDCPAAVPARPLSLASFYGGRPGRRPAHRLAAAVRPPQRETP